jgi:cbb3-type cytochrome oxidase maturation protein
MESLYLLVPLSVLLILAMIGVFAWALHAGQFDDLSLEGERLLLDGESSARVDADQATASTPPKE